MEACQYLYERLRSEPFERTALLLHLFECESGHGLLWCMFSVQKEEVLRACSVCVCVCLLANLRFK